MWGRGYGCVVFVGGIGGGREGWAVRLYVYGVWLPHTQTNIFIHTHTHILTFSLFSFHSFCTARRDA